MDRKTTDFELLALTAGVLAEAENKHVMNEFPQGSISRADGLANWQKFYEVALKSQYVKCHVGPSNIRMRSGPTYEKTRSHGI